MLFVFVQYHGQRSYLKVFSLLCRLFRKMVAMKLLLSLGLLAYTVGKY